MEKSNSNERGKKNLVFNHVGKIHLNLSVKDCVAEIIFFFIANS